MISAGNYVRHYTGAVRDVMYFYAVYGWMNTFPIEVEKGQVVNLEVGYNKGAPAIRRRVMVEYDDSGK